MFQLYGKNPRCIWCTKACKENYKEIVMAIKHAKPPMEKAIVCSEACERMVSDTCKFIEKGMPLFLAGWIIGIIMAVSGIFSPVIGNKILPVSIGGLLILGITIFAFPFVTPQTVKIFGLKKGMILGRISGVILFILAIILILKTK